MRRYLNRFVLVSTAIVGLGYAYAATRLLHGTAPRLALAAPFFLVWVVPIVYWVGERDGKGRIDDLIHVASYLSMGWLSFLLVLLLARDLLLLGATYGGAASLQAALTHGGGTAVFALSAAALVFGAVRARRGPCVHEVDVPIGGLAPDLDGFRIVQISDLHVGPTIRRAYVERVVERANALGADLVALTGDIVDGGVDELAPHVAPLAALSPRSRVFLALGNHDYYSGAGPWTRRFEELGIRVLRNANAVVARGRARILVGGVLDPAARLLEPTLRPDPERAMAVGEAVASEGPPDLRLLLAHNPRIAPAAAQAGFDLQLSGHTHGGQFVPWTLVTRLVHAPHFVGLSRQDRMWVYVSAGTGTWGPPLRIGTEPELTLIRLRCAAPTSERDDQWTIVG